MYDCVILCGGHGTRMRSITGDRVPKALVRAGGRELMTYTLELLDPAFVNSLIFAVDHHADQIESWVKSSNLPYRSRFSRQERPGYLSAVQCAMHNSDTDTVLFCHADEIKPGLQLLDALKSHDASEALATVITTQADRLARRWVVDFDEQSRYVRGLTIEPQEFRCDEHAKGVVLAGALILNRAAGTFFDPTISPDYLGVVQPLITAGQLGMYLSPTEALFNVGTPWELEDAEEYLSSRAHNRDC